MLSILHQWRAGVTSPGAPAGTPGRARRPIAGVRHVTDNARPMLKLLALLFSGLKLGKLLTTGGTMLLSMFTYAFVFGWRYAVGFVLLIFFHEMGHYIAARQRGLDVGAPTFIPFVGAWIQLKDMPHDAETEAYVGIAGPVAGTLVSLACYYLATVNDSALLLALAYAGFMLNLFNLIPLSPMDGGRITGVISPRVWWVGVPILAGLFVMNPSPMLILIAVLAIPHLLASRNAAVANAAAYYDVPATTRWNYAAWYLGLTAFLAIMTHELHSELMALRA
jgi:Zn-dependent protease